MRRVLGIVLSLLFLLVQGTPSYAGENLLPSSDASWIDTLNYYRLASGLSPVSEDLQLSANVKKHITYLTMSDPKYFTGRYVSRHLENPASPYYSAQGAHSGQEIASTITDKQFQSVDMWMAAPFHAMGFMREGLRTAGWASAYNVRTGFYDTGADIFGGLKPVRTKMITFPGNGSFSRMDSFYGESPDPRESCGTNWRSFSGLPIWVSLLTKPSHEMSAQIITPSGEVLKSRDQVCIVNEFNMTSSDRVYGPAGKAIIKADHMVLIIPRDRLSAGLQEVSLQLHGRPKISWSFTVLAPPPTIAWTATAKPGEIDWRAPVSEAGNPTVGFDVVVGNANLKKFQTYRTTSTVFLTTNMNPGNYWVCVKAIAKYRDGGCPTFESITVHPGGA